MDVGLLLKPVWYCRLSIGKGDMRSKIDVVLTQKWILYL